MSKIKTNIIYNLGYQIFILIIPLITAPYLSRVLGVEGIGTYSYVSSVAYYFFLFITLGLNNYGNRCIAKCEKTKERLGKTFCSIYAMQLSFGVLILSLYVLYIMVFAESQYKIFFILYIPYIISAVIDINWFYYGLTDFKFTTIRSIIVRLISLIFIFLLVRNKNDLPFYFLIMSLTFIFNNILLWPRLKKYVVYQKPNFYDVVIHIKPNLVLFVPVLAISIYRVMDKIMIKELAGILENGYYENADKIITMALTGFSAVATVMMPSVSILVAKGEDKKIKSLLRDSMQICMALGIGMMFGLIAISRQFAPLFFGKEYYETGVLIQLLSVTVVISGWKVVLKSQYLIPYEKDKVYVISLVAGAVVNVICNLYFIPIYADRGAVIGTIIAEITGFIIQTFATSHDLKISIMIKDALLFVPAGIVMCIIAGYIIIKIPGVLGMMISIVIGIIVYSLISYLLMMICNQKRFLYIVNTYIKRMC